MWEWEWLMRHIMILVMSIQGTFLSFPYLVPFSLLLYNNMMMCKTVNQK